MADGYLNFDTKINTDGFNKGISSIGKMVDGVGNTVSGIGKSFIPVTAAVTGMGIAAGKTAIDFTKLYESTMVVFDKMLGGKQAANELYGSLLSIAKASTFSQEAFLTAGKKLVGMGISAQDTTKYMQAITDAVASFGGNSENLTNVAENFAKISTAGRLSMEDVNMLSDNGIQALKILGNQYGVTTDEMRDMISNGAVPAKDAMDKLAEGIEGGTDGVNGMTAAMAGMSMAMKGKTLTGALDSLNSGFRGFALNLTGINPTLKETDAGFEESTQRLQQLTAAISTIANILPSASTLFTGITDGIGKLLDKLVGANVAFDEATGKWQNVGGVLGTIQEKLSGMNADSLAQIGNAILIMAAAGAVLPVLGGGISTVGGVLGGLSGIIAPVEKAIGGLPKTFSNAGSGIKGFVKDFGNIKDAILLPMQDIAPKMSGVMSGISEMWTSGPGGKIVGAASEFASNISEKIGSIGPAIAKKFLSITGQLSSFSSYMGAWGSTIGESFAPALTKVAGFAPKFISLLGFGTILGAVVVGLGLLQMGFGEQINGFLQEMTTKGPMVVSNFCNGIAAALPNIMAQGALLLQNLMMAITANLPTLISGGIAIVSALIASIASQLPMLIPMAVQMILTLVASLIGNVGQLIDAGLQLLTGLVTGLVNAIPKIVNAVPQIIGGLVSTLISHLPQILQTGVQIIVQLAVGLVQAIPQLISKIPQIISQIKNAFTSINWGDVGSNIIKGIADGVKNAAKTLCEAAANAAENALNWVKDKLEIHSPSRVFRDQVGKMMALGIGVGFEKNMPKSQIAKTMTNAIGAIKKNAQTLTAQQNERSVTCIARNYILTEKSDVDYARLERIQMRAAERMSKRPIYLGTERIDKQLPKGAVPAI
ncbi:MAG: tape measure protein [Lachnospiraceae bacterium]